MLVQQQVEISGEKQTLHNITLPPAPKVVWAIGRGRPPREFRFGSEARGYHWQQDVPANLVFDIGRSDYSRDWYYAQTQPGRWDIRFAMTPNKPSYTLNIALPPPATGMGAANSAVAHGEC